MRFAVIILALLAMILGPISGSATAHAMHAADPSGAVTAEADFGHVPHAGVSKPAPVQDHCKDGGGACMDANGCRHVGCLTGGPVPGVVVHASRPADVAVAFADTGRPDGLDVAPPLDPPRPRA